MSLVSIGIGRQTCPACGETCKSGREECPACMHRLRRSQPAKTVDPSPEEIRKRAAEIRSEWSERERAGRIANDREREKQFEFPTVSVVGIPHEVV